LPEPAANQIELANASVVASVAPDATGRGGNIRFQDGFIVAFPGELGGNTITANAFAVKGLIAPTCASASAGGNRFTVPGRGGLLASPQEALTTDALAVGLVPLAPLQSAAPAAPPRSPLQPSPSSPVPTARVLPPPATGWKLNEQGLVSLVAETETPAVLPASCQLAVEPHN
jgi:hypothetical protein